MNSRPNWDEYYMAGARWASRRGDCTRRQVGAIVVDSTNRVAGVGYNGSYPGGPSCLAGECPRGRHYENPKPAARNWRLSDGEMVADVVRVCVCGNDWPCPEAVPAGSSYDTGPGACHSVHAEANAILDVSERARLRGARLYVSAEPCGGCWKLIKNTGIEEVRWPDGHWVK